MYDKGAGALGLAVGPVGGVYPYSAIKAGLAACGRGLWSLSLLLGVVLYTNVRALCRQVFLITVITDLRKRVCCTFINTHTSNFLNGEQKTCIGLYTNSYKNKAYNLTHTLTKPVSIFIHTH